jgi:hypothetical protein
VFAGPFDVTAAEAVISAFDDVDRHAVFDLVDRLAAKSLIAIDEFGEDDTRYRLLETIRYCALDRLAEAGDRRGAILTLSTGRVGGVAQRLPRQQQSTSGRDAGDRQPSSELKRWACASRPDLIRPLILSTGYLIRLDDADSGGQDLFESALTALDGTDDIAWAYVAMAASVAIGFTWLTPADETLRQRAEYLAELHDLRLVRPCSGSTTPHHWHRSRRACPCKQVVRRSGEPKLERDRRGVRGPVLLLGRPARRGRSPSR